VWLCHIEIRGHRQAVISERSESERACGMLHCHRVPPTVVTEPPQLRRTP
jgi:hypothetical protein